VEAAWKRLYDHPYPPGDLQRRASDLESPPDDAEETGSVFQILISDFFCEIVEQLARLDAEATSELENRR
jgi:hypothetical protein